MRILFSRTSSIHPFIRAPYCQRVWHMYKCWDRSWYFHRPDVLDAGCHADCVCQLLGSHQSHDADPPFQMEKLNPLGTLNRNRRAIIRNWKWEAMSPALYGKHKFSKADQPRQNSWVGTWRANYFFSSLHKLQKKVFPFVLRQRFVYTRSCTMYRYLLFSAKRCWSRICRI